MGFISHLSKSFNWYILCILLLGAGLRLWQIGEVPKGITHDELGYIYNAYSIATTGKNIFGEILPVFTWMVKEGFPFMPGTIYGMVPFFWFLPLTPAFARLPGALISVADIFLLYLLVYALFNKKPIALLSALFLAISPWHVHFSRTAYDPNFSLFFYLLGIVVFVYEIQKRRLPVFSTLCIFLGIYSYRGMSIIAFPLLLLLTAYGVAILNASRRQWIFFGAAICAIAASMVLVVVMVGKGYTAEGVALFSNAKMQETIDIKIREAEGPLPLRRFFLNKPTLIVSNFRENYIRSYSPEYLFLYTEANQIYSIWSRGRIYFIDLFFIIAGIFFLMKFFPRQAWFIIGLVLIGGLPGGFGGAPYSARNYFLSAIFPIISALGVWGLLSLKLKKKFLVLIGMGILVAYTYALSSYLFDYYNRYASQGAEAWAYSLKQVSREVNKSKGNAEKVMVFPVTFGDVAQYSLYTGISAPGIQEIWQKKQEKNSLTTFTYENVEFISGCPDVQPSNTIVIITQDTCLKESTPSAYIRDFYGNPLWEIYKP
jgi:hypothetical protein